MKIPTSRGPLGPLSRRQLLQYLAVGGAGLAAAACGVSTKSAASASGGEVARGAFKIGSSGAQLPTSDIQIRWMDSGDNKATFFNAFFPAYTQKHPNIQIQYTGVNWNTIQQVVTLGLEHGTAPDCFQLPSEVTPGQAVSNKWVRPFDDTFPGFAKWKRGFPVGTFANGITDFDGKTYGIPLVSSVRLNYITQYNKNILHQAGYDPGSEPMTWNEFRTMLQKITKQGAGKYYGLLGDWGQGGVLSGFVDVLARMAGAYGVSGASLAAVNPFTGHYNFTTDQYIAAVELILAIKSDGSFAPDSITMNDTQAAQQFPLGPAGVMMDGPWNLPLWETQNPDFSFGIAPPPVAKNAKSAYPAAYAPGGQGKWFMPTTTPYASVIADILYNVTSPNGQAQWNDYDGGGDPSVFAAAMKDAKLSPAVQKSYTMAERWTVLGPEPAVRTPKIGDVYEAQKSPVPSWADTMVGLYTGQITDSVPTVMQRLQDSYEASLDAAIDTVNKTEGTNITRDDFLFKDWNPRQPYVKGL